MLQKKKTAGGAPTLQAVTQHQYLDTQPHTARPGASQRKSEQPLVSINLRLKQMLEFARRRNLAGAYFNQEAWLKIYAEGLARREEGLVRPVLVKAAREAGIYFNDDDLAEAIADANFSRKTSPKRSGWSADLIGKALAVSLCERIEFATHLGCFEETVAKRKARKRAKELAALQAKRACKPRAEKFSQSKPWEAEGISRRAWFYRQAKLKATNSQAQVCTKSVGDNRKKKLLPTNLVQQTINSIKGKLGAASSASS